MWRYLAGGLATLMMVAAGWLLFSGRARSDPILPPTPTRSANQAASVQRPEAPVPEASERTREEKRFDRYDKDRDGKIAREEYLAARRKAFVKLDINGDGRLSFEEWAAKTIGKFAGADKDGSGTMDADEFATTKVVRKPQTRCACPRSAGATDE